MTKLRGRRMAASARQRGFTMFELMIASTIALFMLVGVSELYLSSMSTEKTGSVQNDISANGRYAIETLRRELMHAGFRGVTWAEPTNPVTTTIGTITNECLGTGFVTNLRQGVWGANDSNPFSATCIPTANYSTGDVLVVRHAALEAVTTLDSNTIYFRSAYERGEVYKGSNGATLATTFIQNPVFNYPLEVKTFYVNKFSTSASETPLVPALYRVTLGTGPAMTAEMVASNVEDMQIQYGRLTTDLNTRIYNADAVSATATSLTTATSEWDDVSVVRIWLLVRASTVEPGYQNTSTYTLGDKTITVNDGYRREVFSAVVQLRNNG